MRDKFFAPTPEQSRLLEHKDSAFIIACPGAGKTQVMVERARRIMRSSNDGSVAFLSFTRGAVSELLGRLRRESLLRSTVFPHFMGTFDGFVWQFMIAPLGIPKVDASPRLIPDKSSRLVQPYEKSQPLPLSCFDRVSGQIDENAALRHRFDINKKKARQVKAYETCARNMLLRFRDRGELDFNDARQIALERIADKEFSPRLSCALAARFKEIIVDEAQDCNPADLEIVRWLRDAGIPTKVVCDPHQSIYEFRGGVTNQILAFATSFPKEDQLFLSGNFRSSQSICKAIVMLRPLDARKVTDEPLGEFKEDRTPIYVLTYAGRSVPSTIGTRFSTLLDELRIDRANAPLLAATRNSGYNAIGQPVVEGNKDLTFRLAKAVSDFCFSCDWHGQKSAIEAVHKIILTLEGRLSGKTYHQCIDTYCIHQNEWRPQALHILRTLQYELDAFSGADEWLRQARELLAPYLPPGSPSISLKLKNNKFIEDILKSVPADKPAARTIHAVKGKEFPAVCVVTVPQTFKGILDYLETGEPEEKAEAARELYVAASRAQRLLVFASPKSQAARFAAHLGKAGAPVKVFDI